MVKGSKPSFSVGVYGEWGTGKTTLMRLIEEKLKTNTEDEVLFTWGNLQPGNRDYDRLKYFLKENFGTDWLENQEVRTDNDEVISIFGGEETKNVDAKGSYDSTYTHSLSIALDVAITQIGNNFGYLHRLHFSAWHYFCYAIY
jgi:KAP family P-loop domain